MHNVQCTITNRAHCTYHFDGTKTSPNCNIMKWLRSLYFHDYHLIQVYFSLHRRANWSITTKLQTHITSKAKNIIHKANALTSISQCESWGIRTELPVWIKDLKMKYCEKVIQSSLWSLRENVQCRERERPPLTLTNIRPKLTNCLNFIKMTILV